VLAGEEITGDIFYTQRAEVFFARESPVGGQGGAIYYIDRDFETAPGDESISGFRLELSRTVSPTTTATLYGDYYETDFRLIDREDRDSEVGLSLRYRVRRRLAMLAGVEWEDRRSTDPTEEFTEVTGYVGLSFGP
nr:outer membrane beta-barrel protein [Gammaproteobacteria bacterium]NIR85951.1 outer membrane beta-barrel protein [Gammaproteobacteria bacterium]NIU06403.1 outer membrane beta-barrel protein [Gammaproteobacteria bacterium]NIV53297.1 outer membrane beta-barrel protein [Gammaproteobacteria bacterium]NIV76954.1 outer membrane beta-barrel protein [Gammaproteobacteria bacterium]